MIDNVCFEGYNNLAIAVVKQAAVDVMTGMCYLHDCPDGAAQRQKERELNDARRFFQDPQEFAFWSSANGNALLEKVEALVKEYNYDLKQIRKAINQTPT